MAEPLRRFEKMTIEDFLAFAEERPGGERWELVDGVAVMSPSATDVHQVIVFNILLALGKFREAQGCSWVPLPGIGTRAANLAHRLPTPDALVMRHPPRGVSTTDEAMALFEVLSPSDTRQDRDWRLATYRNVEGAEHYVVIRQDRIAVTRYDRAADWRPTEHYDLGASLVLPALGMAIPLSAIYATTRFTERARP